jgi:hypothetical protein
MVYSNRKPYNGKLVPEKSFRTNMERNNAAKQRIVGARFKNNNTIRRSMSSDGRF